MGQDRVHRDKCGWADGGGRYGRERSKQGQWLKDVTQHPPSSYHGGLHNMSAGRLSELWQRSQHFVDQKAAKHVQDPSTLPLIMSEPPQQPPMSPQNMYHNKQSAGRCLRKHEHGRLDYSKESSALCHQASIPPDSINKTRATARHWLQSILACFDLITSTAVESRQRSVVASKFSDSEYLHPPAR